MVPNHARYQLRYASIDILSFNVQVAGYTHVLARRKGNALLGRRSHDGRCSLISAAKTTGDRCFEKMRPRPHGLEPCAEPAALRLD